MIAIWKSVSTDPKGESIYIDESIDKENNSCSNIKLLETININTIQNYTTNKINQISKYNSITNKI